MPRLPELAPRGVVVHSRTASAEHVTGRFAGLDDEHLLRLSAFRVVYYRSPSGVYYAHDAATAVTGPAVDSHPSVFSAMSGEAPMTREELAFVEQNAPLVNARRNEIEAKLAHDAESSDLERRCVAFRAVVRSYPRAFVDEVRPETVVTALVLFEPRASDPSVLAKLKDVASRFFDDAMFTLVCIVLGAKDAYDKLTLSRLWLCFAQSAFANLNTRMFEAVGPMLQKMLRFLSKFAKSSWLRAMLDRDAFYCAFLVLTGAAKHILGDVVGDAARSVASAVASAVAEVTGRVDANANANANASGSVLDMNVGVGIEGMARCLESLVRHSPEWIRAPLGVTLAVVQLWRIVTAPELSGVAKSTQAWVLEARVTSMLETLKASAPQIGPLVDAIPRTIVGYILAAAIAYNDGTARSLVRALFLTRTGFLAKLLSCMLEVEDTNHL